MKIVTEKSPLSTRFFCWPFLSSQVVPSSQAALSDQELAAVASYVLSTFNDSPVALKAEGFAALRSKPLPPGEVRKLREQVLAQIGGQ